MYAIRSYYENGIASSVKCSEVSNNLSESEASESLPKNRIVSSDDRPSATRNNFV